MIQNYAMPQSLAFHLDAWLLQLLLILLQCLWICNDHAHHQLCKILLFIVLVQFIWSEDPKALCPTLKALRAISCKKYAFSSYTKHFCLCRHSDISMHHKCARSPLTHQYRRRKCLCTYNPLLFFFCKQNFAIIVLQLKILVLQVSFSLILVHTFFDLPTNRYELLWCLFLERVCK